MRNMQVTVRIKAIHELRSLVTQVTFERKIQIEGRAVSNCMTSTFLVLGTLELLFHTHGREVGNMRKLTGIISKTKATVIFINQIRMKIGVLFGNPETTTGGNALKFYASVRVDIRRIGQIKDGENVSGNRTKIKVVKNKIAAPFRTAEFDIMYNEGISKTGDVLDLAVQYNVVEKAGAFFKYNGETLGQGREAVKRLFKEKPELMDEIEAKVREAAKTDED
jgi:recombination protein RecA